MPGTAKSKKRDAVTAFKALGDETRLRVLAYLAGGERCVCEIVEDLDVSQSLLSFHLRTLKDAGFVVDRRSGRWVFYALNRDALEQLEGFLGDLCLIPQATRRMPSRCCD
jgi:ArsR family transcriptional regulator